MLYLQYAYPVGLIELLCQTLSVDYSEYAYDCRGQTVEFVWRAIDCVRFGTENLCDN